MSAYYMQAFFILSTQHRADASTPERKSVSMKKKVKVISSLSLAATLIVPSAIVGFAADVETTENPTVSVVNFSPESGNKSTNIASMSKIIEQADHMPQSIGVDSSNAKCVNYPDLSINLDNYSVNYMGKNVEMPPKELELLYFLASAPNQVFTREQLLDNIWGYEYIGDTRTVDVHIKRIREKIKDHAHWNIETVWGIGYKFVTK